VTAPRPTIEPCDFVRTVQPLLERKDLQGLLDLLKANWTAEQIVSLLRCDDCDARKVAALSLTLVGCQACLPELAKQLKDPDPIVNQMAEHAMWAIWFRGGATPEANHQLARGAMAMERKDIPHAISHFDRAIQFDPNFSEAYNQRAIAKFMQESYEESLADCRKVLSITPNHFGAWAGMGHCHAHLHHVPEAIACYERALSINPHMDRIREAIAELSPNPCDEKDDA